MNRNDYSSNDRAEEVAYLRQKRKSHACVCFSPGEVSGSCPGPAACPHSGDDEDKNNDMEGA